jgi:hypothetical protein
MSHNTNPTESSLKLKSSIKESAANILRVNAKSTLNSVIKQHTAIDKDQQKLPVMSEPTFRQNLIDLLECQDLKQSFDVKKYKK